MTTTADAIAIVAAWAGPGPAPAPALTLALPATETRLLTLNGRPAELRSTTVLGLEHRVCAFRP